MQLPDRESLSRALRRTRNRVLLGIVALLVGVRVALPYVLRSVIVSQTDAALVGRIALADLDLSLIRGGVTLKGLEVYAEEAPSTAPALFEAKQLWTQVSWLAFLTKTIEVEEFALDGFTVRLDRLKDGIVLPKPAPSAEAPEPEPENPEPFGWSLAADSVAFRDGEIHFQDHTVGEAEPQRFDLAIKDLSAQQLALRIDPTGQEPGRIVIQAQLGQGSVGLDARTTQHPGGTGGRSTITLTNLPIDKIRVYLKMFGWSDLTGTLDAVIKHRFEPDGAHQVRGTVSLSNVVARVPKLDRPALGWRKLAIALDKIDLVKQDAAISEVALVGARVVVDAKSKTPVPAVAPPAVAPPEKGDDAEEKAAAEAATPAEPTPPAEPEAPAKPWTWSVRKAHVDDAVVELGATDPLPLGIDAEVLTLSGERGARWPVKLTLKEGAGSIAIDGSLAIAPLAFDGKLAIADLALPPLLARIDAPAVGLLQKGALRANLTLALTPRSQTQEGTPPTDLRVAGTLGLAGLDVREEKTAKDFAVAWKDFELTIRELTLPGLLGTVDPAAPRAIGLNLELVRLVQPAFVITRTEQGVVLPSFGSDTGEAEKADAAEPASPATAKPATAPVQVLVAITKAQMEGGSAQVVDRSVKPFYRTKIERLDVRSRGIRYPGPIVEQITISMKGMQGAMLDVRGRIAPGDSKVTAKLVKLPLAQFNPYVTPTGYGVAGGELSLESKATLKKEDYESETDLVVSGLDVGGSEGEALFEQNFGIPLSVALSLLKDLEGKITLAIPVGGGRGGVNVGLGSIAGQALRKALMGALASPLKLLGAVTTGDKVAAPEPILFVPGTSELAPDGSSRIEQIAALLSASPGIALTLTGGTSESDVHALQERALLAELEATSGVRALGQLGEIGTRRAVRQHLQAKLAGEEPPALEPEQETWLESHVSAEKIEPAALATLAATRAAAAQSLLVREHGIAAERLPIGPPATEPPAAQPGVAIGLGAPRGAAPTS